MKFNLTIFMIFLCRLAYAQLTDNFTDGNFSLNPVWSGSASNADFTVADNRLRSNSTTASSNFYISTPNTLALNTSWEFWVNLQFSTSGANYTDIYLISDKADLQNASINGYFVRIGNTDDEISLYKRSGTLSSAIKIIDGVNGSIGSSNNTVRIKVSRSTTGLFTLEREVVATGSSFFTEGSVTDLTFTTSAYFGIYIQQSTASFFQKHFFDDFKIQTIATEPVPPIPVIPNTYKAKFGDIIINEIFADPSPQIDLPSVEFVELFNTSGENISLKGWQFADPGTSAALSEISMAPKSYLVLCAKADTAEFKKFGKVLGISPWPSLNNASDALKLISPENLIIDSVQYSDSWHRTTAKKAGGWTLEKRDLYSKCLGLFNWSASIDTSGGTPGRKNSIYLENYDASGFKADSLKMTSDTTITIYFNKHLNSSDLAVSNFNLSPALNLKKIDTDSELKEISLLFTQKFASATEYLLYVMGIKDCSGTLLKTPQPLTFKTPKPPVVIPPPAIVVNPYKAKFGDVMINEIFADPAPQVDLPSVEFVELFNTSTETIPLKNWELADPGTYAVLSEITIAPKSYLILCAKADTAEFKRFGKVLGVSPWPSLNNASDALRLISAEKLTIDSVHYSDQWYRNTTKKAGGWTLEKRDLYSKCLGLFNWSASIDTSGGTPGRKNSIYLENYDASGFKADSLKMTSDTTIKVYFNKHLNASDLAAANFNFHPVLTIKKTSADLEFKEVSLLFSQKFAASTEYILSLTEIKDCGGSSLKTQQSLSFKTAKAPPVIPERQDKGRIQITEIFADPSPEVGLPLSEFIEIYNPDTDTVNLDLWTIKDPLSKSAIRNQFIAPKEYIILCAIADTTLYKPFGKTIGINPWPSLNNSSDQIIMKSFKNRLVDSIAYSDTWYKNEEKKKGGYSLEMIDPTSACNSIQNWNASKHASGGTPGKQNSVFDTGTAAIPLKLIEARLTDSISVILTFNKGIDSLSGSIPQHFSLNNGVGEPLSALPVAPNFDQVLLKFKQAPARGNNYKVVVNNITDCAGTLVAPDFNSASFILTEKIRKGDILISEILFNPKPNGVDFIEIYNTTKHVLDLQELSLSTIVKDTLSSIKALSSDQLLIEPDQYLVLTTNPDNIKQEYQTKDHFLKLTSLPAFNDDAGTAVLLNQKVRIDQLNYTEKMHFQLLKNLEGVSLERSSFTKQANEMGNFRSATASSGYATPGYKNSQQNPDHETQEEFSLSSKTFSPDNDGFEDLLEINYHLDKPGLIANVNIYNDRGVLVKKLLKNFTLSTEGVFTWDGLNEFKSLPGIGLYILSAELFDTDGNLKKFTKSFALAVKL